jgi:hypothetical protein
VMPCPRCGYPCQVGTAYCPSCQLQLVPGAPNPAGMDQMPAWMRNVQAGQAPGGGPPAPDGGAFSARGLINEDVLPQWLREAGAGGAQQPPQGPPPAYGAPIPPPPAWGQAAGAPGQGFGPPPRPGGAAQNLFDESNLPDWLRQYDAGAASQRQYDAYPTVRQPAANGQPQPPTGSYNGAAASQQSAFPGIEQAGVYRPAPSGGLSGNSLLDNSALPGWMRGDQSLPQVDPAAAYRDASGMRGNSLIDDAALPSWLRNQPDTPAAAPAPAMPPSSTPAAPSIANWIGGSAANDAMPAWLGQAYSDARVPPLQPPQAPAAMPQAPNAPWPPNGMAPNGMAPNGMAPNGMAPNGMAPLPGTLSANSLMDESALPEWLRAQGPAGAGAGPMSAAPPPYGGPQALGASHAGTLADMHTAHMPQPGRPEPQPPQALPPATAYPNEPAPQRFSASDLIDPDLLPGFLQAGGPGAPAGGQPPFGAPASHVEARSRAPEQWPDREAEAFLTSERPAVERPVSRVPRGAPIPEDELPPWLQPEPMPMQRGGPSARNGAGYDSRRMPVPRDWNDDDYDASEWMEEDMEVPDDYGDPPRDQGRRRGRERRGDGDRQRDERDDGRRYDDDAPGADRGGPSGRRRGRRGFLGR